MWLYFQEHGYAVQAGNLTKHMLYHSHFPEMFLLSETQRQLLFTQNGFLRIFRRLPVRLAYFRSG